MKYTIKHEERWLLLLEVFLVHYLLDGWSVVNDFYFGGIYFRIVSNTSKFRAIFLWLFTFPGHWRMTKLRKLIKWVLLIQTRFRQMFWVLWAKGNTWEKTHFEILGLTNCDTETLIWFSTKINTLHYLDFCSSDSNLKIDPEISQSRKFMMKNPFWDFEFYTFGIHCDSSSSPRAKMRPVTLEKFSKHGFSFFYQILPFSFESWSMCYFGCLI